jgi:hypothetical protein
MTFGGLAVGVAGALDTQLVHRGRQLSEGNVEGRQIIGARQGIVQRRATQQLARLPVVNRVFEQRVPDALGYSALNLANLSASG